MDRALPCRQVVFAALAKGPGVRLLSVDRVTRRDGAPGVRAFYAFGDVRKLRIANGPVQTAENEANCEMDLPEDGPAKPTPLTFDFVRGVQCRLVARIPQPPAGRRRTSAAVGRSIDNNEIERLKRDMAGFRYRLVIRVDGAIQDTNAAFVESGSANGRSQYVTLVDMNIGRLLKDEGIVRDVLFRDSSVPCLVRRLQLALKAPGFGQ